MSDTEADRERFVFSLWSAAPDEWVNPEEEKFFSVTEAEVVGEPGDEEIVIEVERKSAGGSE